MPSFLYLWVRIVRYLWVRYRYLEASNNSHLGYVSQTLRESLTLMVSICFHFLLFFLTCRWRRFCCRTVGSATVFGVLSSVRDSIAARFLFSSVLSDKKTFILIYITHTHTFTHSHTNTPHTQVSLQALLSEVCVTTNVRSIDSDRCYNSVHLTRNENWHF